ncbi:MAG TPA: ribbon-helix-helix protein, CopG family [Bryobacteraceae bacterium]|jgi:predicted transcriptional regulator
MATVKVTFTLDEATVNKLNRTALNLAKPKSEVVREAINDYYVKSDRLSDEERERMLRVLDEMMARPPTRTQAEVDRELRQIRASRKRWGRRTEVPGTR